MTIIILKTMIILLFRSFVAFLAKLTVKIVFFIVFVTGETIFTIHPFLLRANMTFEAILTLEKIFFFSLMDILAFITMKHLISQYYFLTFLSNITMIMILTLSLIAFSTLITVKRIRFLIMAIFT